jgi:hypothetical protein
MQALVARDTGHPDDRVIGSISRCDPRGASAGLTHAPGEGYGGWICWRNFICPDRSGVVMKANIRSLAGVVRDS